MNCRKLLRLGHVFVLAAVASWGTTSWVAAQDTPTVSVVDSSLPKPPGRTKNIAFTVSRSGDTSYPVTVGYQTQDNTAEAGADYIASEGVITIPVGATGVEIEIPVLPGQASTRQDFILDLTGSSGPLLPGADLRSLLGFATAGRFFGITPADFNNDGRLDIAGLDDFNTVSFFLNTSTQGGLPSFAPLVSLALGDSSYALEIDAIKTADFNDDGKPDLAIMRADGTIAVMINSTPQGVFAPQFAEPALLSSGRNPTSMAIADFDGDGKPDLAVASGELNVAVFLNSTPKGSATVGFSDRQTFTAQPFNAEKLIAADLNSDSRVDLAIRSVPTKFGANGVFFLLNTSDGKSPVVRFTSTPDPYIGGTSVGFFLTAADLNNDGLPELFTDLKVFLNTTPAGTLLPSFSELTTTENYVTVATDIDADGQSDLVSGRSSVFFNQTDRGAATPIVAAPVDFEFGFVRSTGDFNGDGKHELIAVDDEQDTLMVGALPFRIVGLLNAQATGNIRPTADTQPRRFAFIDRQDVVRGQIQISNTITVRGINRPTPIAVSRGSYSINGGAFSATAGRVKNGDRVRIRQVSAGEYGTEVNAKLTIGGVSDTFTTRTKPAPSALSLAPRSIPSGAVNQADVETETRLARNTP